jgi:alkaline phosphatase D
VSKYRDFRTIEKKGAGATGAYRDYTVKVLAKGLKSQQKYYYRFLKHHKGTTYVSPVGHFRLPAPPGATQKALKYAIVSCTNWGYGYFNVYNAMSKIKELDFWMHVGMLYIFIVLLIDRNSSVIIP